MNIAQGFASVDPPQVDRRFATNLVRLEGAD